jgi:hypothetical protein
MIADVIEPLLVAGLFGAFSPFLALPRRIVLLDDGGQFPVVSDYVVVRELFPVGGPIAGSALSLGPKE